MDRRRLLLLVALGAALAVAGCLGGHGASPGEDAGGDGSGGGDGGGDGSGGGFAFYDGSADPDPNATDPDASPHEDPEGGYRVLVPDAWSRPGDGAIWYVGPDPGIDEPRRNVNVVVGPAQGMDQEAYVEASVGELRRVMDVDEVDVEAGVLGGDDASRIVVHGTYRGTQLTWLQLVAVHGDTAYTVTYTFPQGEDPGHEEELETFLESFAFLDGADGASDTVEGSEEAPQAEA